MTDLQALRGLPAACTWLPSSAPSAHVYGDDLEVESFLFGHQTDWRASGGNGHGMSQRLLTSR